MIRKCARLIVPPFFSLLALASMAAPAGAFQTLYNFCNKNTCGTNGTTPPAGLTFQLGVAYTTTSKAGANGAGTVIAAGPNYGSNTWFIIYSFCSQAKCTDGANPLAGVTLDLSGTIYGTTSAGGSGNWGTVYKITTNKAITETVLYSFCFLEDCTDGASPAAGVVMDNNGNLYGTTTYGGTYNAGTVFKIAANGRFSTLYSFCAKYNCTDGSYPLSAPVLDNAGNLYGTTLDGGTGNVNGGTVFSLAPDGTENVLYSFCSNELCTDGANPRGTLIRDGQGNLYGTTYAGGNNQAAACGKGGCGLIFTVDSKGKESGLYSFCAKLEKQSCLDGANPAGGLSAFINFSAFFGTTFNGGPTNSGTVFRFEKGALRTLQSFSVDDGANPEGGIAIDSTGFATSLYGTTTGGGGTAKSCPPSGCGTIFSLATH